MKTAQKAYLQIKIASLAAEAVLIRKAENRYRAAHKNGRINPVNAGLAAIRENRSASAREAWLGLKQHRRFDVRSEARAALLAYGFLRDRAYLSIEAKCWEKPDWKRVEQIAFKFGDYRGKDLGERIKAWAEEQPALSKAA